MKLSIATLFHNLSNIMAKMSVDEEVLPTEAPTDDLGSSDPAMSEPAPEEKDTDTLMQEHVKTNQDKYRTSFENLFPKAQMVAKNVEYHGAVDGNKIRVLVDFEAPLLNFDALQILSNKEIGLEATGESAFKVYSIYLPMVKDSTLK